MIGLWIAGLWIAGLWIAGLWIAGLLVAGLWIGKTPLHSLRLLADFVLRVGCLINRLQAPSFRFLGLLIDCDLTFDQLPNGRNLFFEGLQSPVHVTQFLRFAFLRQLFANDRLNLFPPPFEAFFFLLTSFLVVETVVEQHANQKSKILNDTLLFGGGRLQIRASQ